jgi:hypothetical protein
MIVTAHAVTESPSELASLEVLDQDNQQPQRDSSYSGNQGCNGAPSLSADLDCGYRHWRPPPFSLPPDSLAQALQRLVRSIAASQEVQNKCAEIKVHAASWGKQTA